jgi:mycothiol system anti-sigma-R factor
MNVINFDDRNCNKIRAYLDSYINNELLVETCHEVLKHLEVCAGCTGELDARLRAKKLLRNAVMRDSAPAGLRERIQRELGKEAAPNRRHSDKVRLSILLP